MTIFLRLLSESDKASALLELCDRQRAGGDDPRSFDVAPDAFDAIPGKPFAYWVSEAVRETFMRFDSFECNGRFVKHGLTTGNDDRFVRVWWETPKASGWLPFAKGGNYSPYYADQQLLLKWFDNGAELRAGYQTKSIPGTRLDGNEFFGRRGITWPLRAHRFSPQTLNANASFSARGYCAFLPDGTELIALAIFNSCAFDYLFKVALGRFGFPEFIVGILQILPWPSVQLTEKQRLTELARHAWSLKRALDTANQTSHAFTLPALLQVEGATLADRAAAWKRRVAETQEELADIQRQIDAICFDLYGFSAEDRAAALSSETLGEPSEEDDEEGDAANFGTRFGGQSSSTNADPIDH
ncbi:hypothetical protein Thiowin_03261 [Thiorhodovibrio winogradskyi]|uniref:Site-specific DNA-methyltransferase (adenine-specific) n=1 Tax=Thiorhodovibrio winogradskyi TaxID=77007 RepID=A0ABZ0SCK7_9GAMM|nr:hypothetical protein [Thiorhodovibrio winogradskyi]